MKPDPNRHQILTIGFPFAASKFDSVADGTTNPAKTKENDMSQRLEEQGSATQPQINIDEQLRNIGPDSTATFADSYSNPAGYASSKNLAAAEEADLDEDEEEEDDDLDDEDLDEEDDLEEDEEDEDDEDNIEYEDDDEDDDDDEDEEEEEV